jgi:DNA-binding MarR family transcriptional regulator
MSNLPDRQHPVNDSGSIPASRSRSNRARRTPAGDAFSGLVTRVFRLNGLLAAEGESLARPAGQTTARWQLLAMVENGPATVAQTARTLGLARQSVQRVADVLEAAGLVAYTDNPHHRRARLVGLTDAGRRTLSEIQAVQRPWADAIGRRVGANDLRKATDVLDRLLGVMTARRARDM